MPKGAWRVVSSSQVLVSQLTTALVVVLVRMSRAFWAGVGRVPSGLRGMSSALSVQVRVTVRWSMFSIETVVWKWEGTMYGAMLVVMVVMVVRELLLRLDGWWRLGSFVVPVRGVGCCSDGCSWYMLLMDALYNRDVNAESKNIHLERAAHHGHLHCRRPVENRRFTAKVAEALFRLGK